MGTVMRNVAASQTQRRTAIVLALLALAESIPIVESLAGVRVIGFWPLGRILTMPAAPLGWILATIVAIAFIALTAARNSAIRSRLTEFGPLKPLALLLALTSGITEELFFRGVVIEELARHGADSLAQIALSALVFGAVHVVWIGLAGPRGVIGVVGATTLLGAALAVVYLASGHSVVPCVVTHVAINAVLEPWLVLTAAERRWGGAGRAA